MLYLIRSFTRTGSFLKVGYSGDIEKRMKQYLVENPGRELVGTREGDLTEETRMHLYLTACGFKAGFLEEWFIDCPEVITGFHQSRSKVDKVVWNNRGKLFTAFDFSRRSFKVQIYEELRFKFRASNLNLLSIDREWRVWNQRKDQKARLSLVEEGYLEYDNRF